MPKITTPNKSYISQKGKHSYFPVVKQTNKPVTVSQPCRNVYYMLRTYKNFTILSHSTLMLPPKRGSALFAHSEKRLSHRYK